jgi:Uma2 family endonuclease
MVLTLPSIAPPKLKEQDPDSQRVVLHGVSWATYESMLADLGDRRPIRLAYATGILEITMPSRRHEIINRVLARIIATLTEELELGLVDLGSTTFNRSDLAQGIEPDSCFYIQNAAQIQGINPVLPIDLPPDLAIEVDITSSSVQRLPIYQRLEIPEVWRYTQQEFVMLHLQEGVYRSQNESRAFPMLTIDQLLTFIQQRETLDDNGVTRNVRKWIRDWISHQSV